VPPALQQYRPRSKARDKSICGHHDLDRIGAFAAVRIADRGAAEQRLNRIVDVALLDLEEFEAVLIDRNAQTRPRLANRIVDVDDVRHRRALTPVHWLLLSLAAWRALYQLAFAPYAWEKTEHGLARSSRRAANSTRSLLELERYLTALKETGDLPTLVPEATERATALRSGSNIATYDLTISLTASRVTDSAADRPPLPRACGRA
jgi:hypothetical protein